MKVPLSIGMPVFNGARYIEAALHSILTQDYGEFELIISDNASTDATESICRSHAANDDRIRYIRQPRNLGAAANYNSLVAAARGEIFKWAAHDDMCAPGLFAACVGALHATDERTVLAHAGTRIIDEHGKTVRDIHDVAPLVGDTPEARLAQLLRGGTSSILHFCSPVFGFVRTDVLRRTRLIQRFRAADAVLLVELALRGAYVAIDDHLFLRRKHEGNSVVINATPEAVVAWYDPATTRTGFPMPRTRLLVGLLTAVNRAPLSPRSRARALVELSKWLARDERWRVIGGEFKIKARELLP